LDAFENDWEKRWLIERAIEIVSKSGALEARKTREATMRGLR
jgi:hypothetical protein